MQGHRKLNIFNNRNIFAMVRLQSACGTMKGNETGEIGIQITETKHLTYYFDTVRSTKDFKQGLAKIIVVTER